MKVRARNISISKGSCFKGVSANAAEGYYVDCIVLYNIDLQQYFWLCDYLRTGIEREDNDAGAYSVVAFYWVESILSKKEEVICLAVCLFYFVMYADVLLSIIVKRFENSFIIWKSTLFWLSHRHRIRSRWEDSMDIE